MASRRFEYTLLGGIGRHSWFWGESQTHRLPRHPSASPAWEEGRASFFSSISQSHFEIFLPHFRKKKKKKVLFFKLFSFPFFSVPVQTLVLRLSIFPSCWAASFLNHLNIFQIVSPCCRYCISIELEYEKAFFFSLFF